MVGRAPPPPEVGLPRVAQAAKAVRTQRQAFFGAPWGKRQVPVVTRQALSQRTDGPLLIDEYDATIVVPPDFRAWLDEAGNVVMEANDAAQN
jgi:N-methylhydantoinase A